MKGIPYMYERSARVYRKSARMGWEWIAQQWTLFDCSRINDLLLAYIYAYIYLSIYIYIYSRVYIETKQVRDRR